MKCVALVAPECSAPTLNEYLDWAKVNWEKEENMFPGLFLEIDNIMWAVTSVNYTIDEVYVQQEDDDDVTRQLTIQQCIKYSLIAET